METKNINQTKIPKRQRKQLTGTSDIIENQQSEKQKERQNTEKRKQLPNQRKNSTDGASQRRITENRTTLS